MFVKKTITFIFAIFFCINISCETYEGSISINGAGDISKIGNDLRIGIRIFIDSVRISKLNEFIKKNYDRVTYIFLVALQEPNSCWLSLNLNNFRNNDGSFKQMGNRFFFDIGNEERWILTLDESFHELPMLYEKYLNSNSWGCAIQ